MFHRQAVRSKSLSIGEPLSNDPLMSETLVRIRTLLSSLKMMKVSLTSSGYMPPHTLMDFIENLESMLIALPNITVDYLLPQGALEEH